MEGGDLREAKTHADDPVSERFVAMTMAIACDEVSTREGVGLAHLSFQCKPMEE